MADSRPHSSLVPSLKDQITGAYHGGMFILEGFDCFSRLWAEASGTAPAARHVIVLLTL